MGVGTCSGMGKIQRLDGNFLPSPKTRPLDQLLTVEYVCSCMHKMVSVHVMTSGGVVCIGMREREREHAIAFS